MLIALREALMARRAPDHHIGLSAQFQRAPRSLGGEQVECVGAVVVQAVGSAAARAVIDSWLNPREVPPAAPQHRSTTRMYTSGGDKSGER